MEFLSSLYLLTIIPQGSHKLLKRYIRAKNLIALMAKRWFARAYFTFYLLKACLLHPPRLGVELPTFPERASSDRSLYH